ncbi:hypothetical protein MMC22_010807 [Lobaria immixta]|nr:hypothetical protein [Lobaria immixta]
MSMLVTKTVVGTARVARIMACDLDPLIPYRVSPQDLEHDSLLTETFRKSIHHTGNERTSLFNPTSIDDYQGERIPVIRSVLDKTKIAMLLLSLLLISPVLGIVVASSTHRAGVGVAVSAGVGVAVSTSIIGLASFLQALAPWFET